MFSKLSGMIRVQLTTVSNSNITLHRPEPTTGQEPTTLAMHWIKLNKIETDDHLTAAAARIFHHIPPILSYPSHILPLEHIISRLFGLL